MKICVFGPECSTKIFTKKVHGKSEKYIYFWEHPEDLIYKKRHEDKCVWVGMPTGDSYPISNNKKTSTKNS